MMVKCFKCQGEFDPEEEGCAEIRGLSEDGEQTSPTIYIHLDCAFGEDEQEAE